MIWKATNILWPLLLILVGKVFKGEQAMISKQLWWQMPKTIGKLCSSNKVKILIPSSRKRLIKLLKARRNKSSWIEVWKKAALMGMTPELKPLQLMTSSSKIKSNNLKSSLNRRILRYRSYKNNYRKKRTLKTREKNKFCRCKILFMISRTKWDQLPERWNS